GAPPPPGRVAPARRAESSRALKNCATRSFSANPAMVLPDSSRAASVLAEYGRTADGLRWPPERALMEAMCFLPGRVSRGLAGRAMRVLTAIVLALGLTDATAATLDFRRDGTLVRRLRSGEG